MEKKGVLLWIRGRWARKHTQYFVYCLLTTIFLGGLCVSDSFSASEKGEGWRGGHSGILGTGGPDAYGYTWIDSDTIGGPTFNWIDTTSSWTQVTGLGDDNVVSFFPVGFDFPYYWYSGNLVSVGSNGYIAFGDNALDAADFQTLPSPTRPNNTLAPLMDDLDFTATGSCFYYTNTALDTFIVSYLDVPFWNVPGSSNTFQIILSRPDSSITFQYLDQTGGSISGTQSVGIEDVTGTIGLQYIFGGAPPVNLIHDSLAILFTPPDSSTLQVSDVGIVSALTDQSKGIFLLNGQPITHWTKVQNYGNQTVGTFNVICVVRNPSNAIVFADTILNSGMIPGQVDSVVFTPAWIPIINGQHRAIFSTALAGDFNSNNNSTTVEVRVVTYPTILQFDDGTSEHPGWNWSWGVGSTEAGMGMYFIPPTYPTVLQDIRFYFTGAGSDGFKPRIYDDDGPGGSPGTILFEDSLGVFSTGFLTVDVSSLNITINDGGFYVAWIQFSASPPTLGIDQSPPFSRRGLEYTGVWADFRNSETDEVMIRVSTTTPPGVEEESNVQLPITHYQLIQNQPNPFRNSTSIQYNIPSSALVSIRVYDLSGQLVKTLVEEEKKPGIYRVEWDGKDSHVRAVSSGIYFYKLTSGEKSLTQKMIHLK